jgi:arylformamidase
MKDKTRLNAKGYTAMNIIDITQELFNCTVYPGDTAPSFERVKTFNRDGLQLTDLTFCAHNGTHIDAPCHFIDGGKSIEQLDLSIFIGSCRVVASLDAIPQTERLLLKGDIEITPETAKALVQSGVKLLGVEAQTVGGVQTHVTLLSGGVIPLEGLCLTDVPAGEYTLIATPLKLGGCDGSPVRAVLLAANAA